MKNGIHIVLILLLSTVSPVALAGSATWVINPSTNDWNTATNWTPITVPNGPNDRATFNLSNSPNVVIHSNVQLNGLIFDVQAFSSTVTTGDASSGSVASLTLSGLGIVENTAFQLFYAEAAPTLATNGARNKVFFKNDATAAQSVLLYALGGTSAGSVGGQVQFLNDSTLGPGSARAFAGENGGSGGEVWFLDNSSASKEGGVSNGHLDAYGSDADSTPGMIVFKGTSSAVNAGVTNWGAKSAGGEGGKTLFLDSSNAGTAGVSALSGGISPGENGGTISFSDIASAGSALLRAHGSSTSNGGLLQFLGDSSGGTAQVLLDDADNATFDISAHNRPGLTIGSLNGLNGTVSLGANTLTVGSNNLTSSYSGLIEGSGSLTKIGTAVLALKGNNTYSGGTTIKGGTLKVTNETGSVTGTGPVNIRHAVLAGDGTIAGSVTLGRGASLGPNDHRLNNLTIQGALSFLAASTYSWQLELATGAADEVVANSVAIASGARIKAIAPGSGTLVLGTTFVVINNTSVNPITGTFDNLPDGGIVAVKGNNLQANYSGGDGNDLTLTVL